MSKKIQTNMHILKFSDFNNTVEFKELITSVINRIYKNLIDVYKHGNNPSMVIRVEPPDAGKLLIKRFLLNLSILSHEKFGRQKDNDYFTSETPEFFLSASNYADIRLSIKMRDATGRQVGKRYCVTGISHLCENAHDKAIAVSNMIEFNKKNFFKIKGENKEILLTYNDIVIACSNALKIVYVR